MFSKLSVAFVAALVATTALAGGSDGQCNTGPNQCCQQTGAANSQPIATLLGLLGIVVQDVTAGVGINCTPITAIGAGSGATCTQQPVCCTDNQFNGLVAIGCTPINLSL
ncbi:hydrophobin [Rickenella mellea]|uniref:Hydrophobin n=1 Tax=Rickenella mellea TaxID=50990 RepID=A0A4Y7QKQ2_9AGAM|nr:hydrophobin [Rickenella mellea]